LKRIPVLADKPLLYDLHFTVKDKMGGKNTNLERVKVAQLKDSLFEISEQVVFSLFYTLSSMPLLFYQKRKNRVLG
jgi:hypothetical protein